MRRLAALALLLAWPAAAEEVVLGLSRDAVEITATFDGSDILIFGAVSRSAPAPEGDLDVIVTVAGPSEPVTVRAKERRAGIWVNVEGVEIDLAPSFYAVLSTGPLPQVLSETEDLRHAVSIPRAIRSVGAPMDVADPERFTDALIRIRGRSDLYQMREGAVELSGGTLFSASVDLPANLTEGAYGVRIFLTRDGQVIDAHEQVLAVRKVGLERRLYDLAHDRPAIYGLMALAIAIAAGWGASAAFRLIR
ncbi:MAG: TIGR02186 family protein [Paracoccaceae bacterium]